MRGRLEMDPGDAAVRSSLSALMTLGVVSWPGGLLC